MAAPMIPNAGGLSPVKMIAIFCVLLSVGVGTLVAVKKSGSGSGYKEIAFTEQGYDPSFFAARMPDPEPEPEPEPVTPSEPLPPPPIPPAGPIPAVLPPPPMMDLLPVETVSAEDAVAQAREVRNSQRRGQVAVRVQNPVGFGLATKAGTWELSQAKWDEPRTEASLPVDLSRTFPVSRWIDAILINEINSELPGKVVAQIERNMYAEHGRRILVPAGSKAVGRYQANLKQGQSRIGIIWERIITPEGMNIHCGDAEMTDAMGRSGITGEVDNRFWEKYGMALLTSTIATAVAYSVPVNSKGQGIVLEKYSSGIVNVTRQMMQDAVDLRPIISIPAGSRIKISPSKDVWFKPVSRSNTSVLPVSEEAKK